MSPASGKSSLQESVLPTPFPTTGRNKPKAGASTGGKGPDGARDLLRASASEQQRDPERLSRREHDPMYVPKPYLWFLSGKQFKEEQEYCQKHSLRVYRGCPGNQGGGSGEANWLRTRKELRKDEART